MSAPLLRRVAAYPRRLPLRVTLVAAVLALVAAALVATGFVATALMRNYLLDRVDAQLTSEAQTLQTQASRLGGGPFLVRPRARAVLELPNARYVALTDASGDLVRDVPDEVSQQSAPRLPRLTAADVAARQGEPYTADSVAGGGRWRLVTVPLPGTDDSLTIGQSLRDVSATTGRLVRVEALVGLLVLVVLAGVAYQVIRRSLQPLTEVEETAAAIAGGDLGRRVPERDPRTEAGRLAQSLNAMLGQIESAFRVRESSEQAARASETRMRRFVADASHELRTPLTSIRGYAELYRQGAVRDQAQLTRTMGRIEGEATRMGGLVEDLLLLARLDERRPLDRAAVDLLELAADAVHDAQALDPSRQVRLVANAAAPPVVLGDAARLRQVVANLMSNALTHTPEGTAVTVRVGSDATTATLEVADRGPGLTPEQRERVFERFYRVEESRTRASGGAGLGLAIVAALVAAHDGQVSVESLPGHGATFRVTLPLLAADATT